VLTATHQQISPKPPSLDADGSHLQNPRGYKRLRHLIEALAPTLTLEPLLPFLPEPLADLDGCLDSLALLADEVDFGAHVSSGFVASLLLRFGVPFAGREGADLVMAGQLGSLDFEAGSLGLFVVLREVWRWSRKFLVLSGCGVRRVALCKCKRRDGMPSAYLQRFREGQKNNFCGLFRCAK